MPPLSVDTSLEGWLPAVRFIPSKEVSTDKGGERAEGSTLNDRLSGWDDPWGS